MHLAPAIPILRIFDIARTEQFYVDYLGMHIDFEHRFAPELPLFLQVSRGDLVLHLSEHHGDGTPGTAVYIRVTGVRELHEELTSKHYDFLRPGLTVDGTTVSMQLLDPFGNMLRFEER